MVVGRFERLKWLKNNERWWKSFDGGGRYLRVLMVVGGI